MGLFNKKENKMFLLETLKNLSKKSFQGFCALREKSVNQKIITSFINKENNNQEISIAFHPDVFFVLYSNKSLSTKPCVSSYLTLLKKEFKAKLPQDALNVLTCLVSTINNPVKNLSCNFTAKREKNKETLRKLFFAAATVLVENNYIQKLDTLEKGILTQKEEILQFYKTDLQQVQNFNSLTLPVVYSNEL